MSNDVYTAKAAFVKGPLTECLRAANCGVMALSYALHPDGEEIVTIHYENGHTWPVKVTADSHLAIIRDVTRKI